MASVGHIALAFATALSWLGLGTLLLSKLRDGDNALLDALNRFGAGAIAWALLTAFAGWTGVLYRWVYLVGFVPCTVLGAAVAAPTMRRLPRPRPSTWSHWEQVLGLLIVLYVLMNLISTLAPISSADAVSYHAAGPALFERAHRLVQLPWSWESYQPFSVEMLVLDGFLLSSSVQGALAPLLLGFGAAAAVAGAAYRLGGRRMALLATTIFIAEPFMLWIDSSTFVEPGLALVTALAGWNVWRLRTTGALRFAVLVGIFAGGAGAMKYNGLAVGVGVAIAGLVLARKRVRPATVAAFVLPAILIPLPWYVKNAIVTGNPIYPLLGGPNPEAEANIRAILRGYGRGHGILDAVLVPFRFMTNGASFDRGDFVSPLFLALAPAALLRRSGRPAVLIIFAVSLCYVAAWFVNSQQARYLVPLLPVFAIVAAIGVFSLAEAGVAGRYAASVLVTGALAVGLAISLVYTSQFIPSALGQQSQARFLAHKSSFYEGVAWIDAHVPHGVVLTDIPTTLYLRPPYIVASASVLPTTTSPVDAVRRVRCSRVQYIAFVRSDTTLSSLLGPALGRFVGRTDVHTVTSRTLDHIAPAGTLLVYAIAPVGVGQTAKPCAARARLDQRP